MELPVNQVITGDALEVMRGWPEKSVQCCVTSPPYWGLRDYGTATWEGGDGECDHTDARQVARNLNHSASEQRQGRTASKGKLRDGVSGVQTVCRCGAKRIDQQLGLEKTPEEFVAKMVEVFREVRRVLRDDGTLWLNLGDSYNSGTQFNHHSSGLGAETVRYSEGEAGKWAGHRQLVPGLKHKDLCGIPWRVAFALQADGWYLRQDIIWHKPNPMPESVTDRCTKAHEYIFLLTKKSRYSYDAAAIYEPCSPNTNMRVSQDVANQIGSARAYGKTNGPMKAVINPNRKIAPAGSGIKANDSFEAAVCLPVQARNKRSVWTVTTRSFSEAHFATFPPKLIEPCILAGSKKGDVVFDPFMGAGTVGVVSVRHGRDYVGIELNPEYVEMAEDRIAAVATGVPLKEARRGQLPMFPGT